MLNMKVWVSMYYIYEYMDIALFFFFNLEIILCYISNHLFKCYPGYDISNL